MSYSFNCDRGSLSHCCKVHLNLFDKEANDHCYHHEILYSSKNINLSGRIPDDWIPLYTYNFTNMAPIVKRESIFNALFFNLKVYGTIDQMLKGRTE